MVKRSLVLILFCCAEVAIAQAPPSGGMEFIRGQQAMRKRDITRAIRSFEKSLQENPDLLLAHYYLGYAYQSSANWGDAGENFEAFLQGANREDPLSTELIYYATRQGGLALARTDAFRRAIPYLEEVIANKPDDKQAHFFLGLALLKNGDKAESLQQFHRVIELDSAYSDALYYSGQVSSELGDSGAARERLESFVKLNPHSTHAAEAHFTLGTIAMTEAQTAADPSGPRERAKTHLERYLALEPEGVAAEQAKELLSSMN